MIHVGQAFVFLMKPLQGKCDGCVIHLPGGDGPLGIVLITLIDVGSWRAEHQVQVRHFPFPD